MGRSRHTQQELRLEKELGKIQTFFTVDELHQAANKDAIGIATAYRFLKRKMKEGTLYSYHCGKKTVYSRQDRSHCHFICERTGKTIHFTMNSLDFLQGRIPGRITSVQIEIHGICDDCTKKDA